MNHEETLAYFASQSHPDFILSQAHALKAKGADEGELYFQHHFEESWSLEQGRVKHGAYEEAMGMGARVVSGEKTGYAYTEDLSSQSIEKTAQMAGEILEKGHQGTDSIQAAKQAHVLYGHDNPLHSLSDEVKVSMLKQADVLARSLDTHIQDVCVTLSGEYDRISIATVDGGLYADHRPLIHASVRIVLEKDGRQEVGYSGGGGRYGFDRLEGNLSLESMVYEALRQARVLMRAKRAPAGRMGVILGPGWPGMLLHEAVGHGLEGDFNRKKISTFSERIGEQIAHPDCTVVDDGTLKDRRGSLNIDDEGTPTTRTTLIENGHLKGYLFDRMNARLMGLESTGNGRRESYLYAPLPRMTNTFMLPGPDRLEDMIASMDEGIYAVNFSGGQVDITSGKFVFTVSEGYAIQNGKIGEPIKGATLIGDGAEVLKSIEKIGNDFALDLGQGMCGKAGQQVPVGVGMPSVLLRELTVGGTEA